jgi:beta-N-acetylhexosaminidase
MTLGPVMVDVEGATLTDEERELLRHPLVGGVILFSRNYRDRGQLQGLTAEIHGLREPELLIAVDQEGGRVQRFRSGFTELPSLAAVGDCYKDEPSRALSIARDCGWLMAIELRTVGVDFSFAPVLDLWNRHSSVIKDRAFHSDPEVVVRLAKAYIGGMHAAGMAAVGKHFPGHGTVAADSHHELPIDERSYYDITNRDLVPFRRLAAGGLDGIMVAHVVYPQVDTLPAAFSEVWIREILRGELEFQGVIFSDDLNMSGAAGPGGYVERAQSALTAGCDMVLLCNNPEGVKTLLSGFPAVIEPVTQVRLMRMHGRRSEITENSMRTDVRWQSVSSMVAGIIAAPELDLGEDHPA